jgi:hypothetical protein
MEQTPDFDLLAERTKRLLRDSSAEAARIAADAASAAGGLTAELAERVSQAASAHPDRPAAQAASAVAGELAQSLTAAFDQLAEHADHVASRMQAEAQTEPRAARTDLRKRQRADLEAHEAWAVLAVALQDYVRRVLSRDDRAAAARAAVRAMVSADLMDRIETAVQADLRRGHGAAFGWAWAHKASADIAVRSGEAGSLTVTELEPSPMGVALFGRECCLTARIERDPREEGRYLVAEIFPA